MRRCWLALPLLALFCACPPAPTQGVVWLESLDLSHMEHGWGDPQAGKSIEGNPLRLGGRTFAHGVGTHADSVGPKTCAGFVGSLGHEFQDARSYARWGIDYLKYDWCSCQSPDPQAPYRLMRRALDGCGRDIVFSFCQYGMAEVWKWGAQVGGNLWRTSGDIGDSWGSMAGIGFSQGELAPYAGPGHWNDPDMLVVGKLGWGPNPRPTNLGPQEQVTHISLWSLLAAPLLLGCDLAQLDQFTLDLLTNDEVIEVNQDPLGQAASRRGRRELTEVWARPLWDGTLAVGLFNRGPLPAEVAVRWAELGLGGPQPVRDLWQRRDLGTFPDGYWAPVAGHGTLLLKVGRPAAR